MEADLRQPADRFDRRGRGRAVGSQRPLRRQRRRAGTARPVGRRRRLQIDRRAARRGRISACATGSRSRNIAVDPGNPNRLFVAVARTSIRSQRGARHLSARPMAARSFQKVLFKDVNTGGNDVDIDPSNPNIVYAALWEERQGPWENAQWRGTGGGIYKSTDGGSTWKQLTNGSAAERRARRRRTSRSRQATQNGSTRPSR